MKKNDIDQTENEIKHTDSSEEGKKPWQDPKLAFVKPELKKHGTLEDITQQGGFFGVFTP